MAGSTIVAQAAQPLLFEPVTPQAAYIASILQFDKTASLAGSATIPANDGGFTQALLNESASNATQVDNTHLIAEGLFALDNSTLSIFNEIGNDPRSATVTGDLTAQQLQAIGALKGDALLLEQAAALTSPLPLSNSASTVDLSLLALNIVNASTGTSVGINANVGIDAAFTPAIPPTLTNEQLSQLSQIVAPYATQPLTPTLVAQIQEQLVANGLSPMQFSLSTMLLVQNYIASMQPAPHEALESSATADNAISGDVTPVSSVDRVAAEDSAILG